MKLKNYQRKLKLINSDYSKIDIKWIGKIPNDWNLTRGKYVFNSKKLINKNTKCKNLLSLTLNGVLNKDFYSTDGLRPENYNTYQIFQKNDLVFKMIDLANVKTSRVGLVHEEGIMSSAYIRLEPIKEKIHSKFAYWFYFDLYKKEVYNSIGGGVRSTLSSSDMLELFLPTPQLTEQKLISNYLDQKTEKIDLLINKTRNKIKLLKEQHSTLINQSVIKKGKMHRLASLGIFSKGKNIKKDDLTESGYPVILYSHIYTKYERITSEVNFFTSKKIASSATKIKSGSFLFTSSGETREEIGKTLLFKSDKDVLIGGDIIVFNLINEDNFDLEYLSYFFNSQNFQEQKSSSSRGDIIVHIYKRQIRELKICFPSKDEQIKTRKLLDKNEKITKNLIKNYFKKIEILKEYRLSLISSAVTGKFRVTEDML